MLMAGFATDERPFWQTQGVAHALGVNLTDAMAAGLLDRRGYMRLISRCEACPYSESCTVWMSEQHGTAAEAPEYCPNKGELDLLKASA